MSRAVAGCMALLAGGLFAGSPATADEPTKAPAVRLLVRAYVYPARDGLAAWKQLLESANRTPIVVIVNPASGPGRRVDSNYEEVLRLAKSSKATLIGYVTLTYAKRPVEEVKTDVDTWL